MGQASAGGRRGGALAERCGPNTPGTLPARFCTEIKRGGMSRAPEPGPSSPWSQKEPRHLSRGTSPLGAGGNGSFPGSGLVISELALSGHKPATGRATRPTRPARPSGPAPRRAPYVHRAAGASGGPSSAPRGGRRLPEVLLVCNSASGLSCSLNPAAVVPPHLRFCFLRFR